MNRLKSKKRYRWYHGALFLIGITLVERGLETFAKKAGPTPIHQDDREYYRSLKLPVFAPPGKAFPIAWAVNDIALVWAGLRVLNKPRGTAGRSEFIRLQAASWGIYALFTALHFGLRSPLNAFTLTTAHTGLNLASVAIAIRKLQDKRATLLMAPVIGWLVIALPTAATTALWNRDQLYQTGPFLQPREKWLKAG